MTRASLAVARRAFAARTVVARRRAVVFLHFVRRRQSVRVAAQSPSARPRSDERLQSLFTPSSVAVAASPSFICSVSTSLTDERTNERTVGCRSSRSDSE